MKEYRKVFSKTQIRAGKKNSILILGSHGMLGTALCGTFGDYKITAWDVEDLDICDASAVHEKISALKPKIVINAAAYTNVDGAEENKAACFRVNADAINNLSSAAFEAGAIFVHYSTDYVFSGTSPLGYKEDDKASGALNVYGLSKLRGEEILQAMAKKYSNAKWYLIRTSWLFGPNGKNFVRTVYGMAKEDKEIKMVNDQYGKPTYTLDLAVATKQLIEDKFPSGIYHITDETGNRGITWFEFAKEIINIAHFSRPIVPVGSDISSRRAKRPVFSVLINSKFPHLRPWQNALEEYIHEYLLTGKE